MEEPKEKEKELEAAPSVPKKSSGAGKKILIIGLPVFIVQLVVVYFITANILITRIQVNGTVHKADSLAAGQVKPVEKQEPKVEFGKFIYSIEDIFLNPAGTDGKKIFLMSISFDLSSEKDKEVFKEKEILVKDAVITTTSAKNLAQLNNIAYRDTLKSEIAKEISTRISNIKINRIYFSKFIIN